jgi:hypothetical protein
VDGSDLRRALAAFLGETQYRKFVEQGVRRGRLRHWQEESWGEFTAAHPEYAIGLDELSSALDVCPLHGEEFLTATVKVFRGNVDHSREFERARREGFPYSIPKPFSTEGRPFEGNTAEVRYCPTCERAAGEWERRWSEVK